MLTATHPFSLISSLLAANIDVYKRQELLRATILMVTHDAFTASYASRILFLKDGEIFKMCIRDRCGTAARRFFFRIKDTLFAIFCCNLITVIIRDKYVL